MHGQQNIKKRLHTRPRVPFLPEPLPEPIESHASILIHSVDFNIMLTFCVLVSQASSC